MASGNFFICPNFGAVYFYGSFAMFLFYYKHIQLNMDVFEKFFDFIFDCFTQ